MNKYDLNFKHSGRKHLVLQIWNNQTGDIHEKVRVEINEPEEIKQNIDAWKKKTIELNKD